MNSIFHRNRMMLESDSEGDDDDGVGLMVTSVNHNDPVSYNSPKRSKWRPKVPLTPGNLLSLVGSPQKRSATLHSNAVISKNNTRKESVQSFETPTTQTSTSPTKGPSPVISRKIVEDDVIVHANRNVLLHVPHATTVAASPAPNCVHHSPTEHSQRSSRSSDKGNSGGGGRTKKALRSSPRRAAVAARAQAAPAPRATLASKTVSSTPSPSAGSPQRHMLQQQAGGALISSPPLTSPPKRRKPRIESGLLPPPSPAPRTILETPRTPAKPAVPHPSPSTSMTPPPHLAVVPETPRQSPQQQYATMVAHYVDNVVESPPGAAGRRRSVSVERNGGRRGRPDAPDGDGGETRPAPRSRSTSRERHRDPEMASPRRARRRQETNETIPTPASPQRRPMQQRRASNPFDANDLLETPRAASRHPAENDAPEPSQHSYSRHSGDRSVDAGRSPQAAKVATPMSPPSSNNHTALYEYARQCQWNRVVEECQDSPRDAKCVGEKDGTTALHLAVMSRTNPGLRDRTLGNEYAPAPLEVIEEILLACPETAMIRCSIKKYTALSYACLVSDRGYDMDDGAALVRMLLHHAPDSAYVFTDDGFSALDVHILSYTRFHQEREETYSGGRTSTVVLRTLLTEKPDLAQARLYTNRVRGPVELLYRCNMHEFKQAADDDDGDVKQTATSADRKQLAASRFASITSTLSDWWAWKWVLMLLKFLQLPSNNKTAGSSNHGPIFSAVHAATRLVGCPLPILSLAVTTFPKQVRERDAHDDLYNLPLHEVCSWRCDQEIICGDPFVLSRKAKALQLLLEEYPEAARMTNNMGETPLQLAIESCTPWHGGLELLARACPKAVMFPRRLRHHDQDSGRQQLLSVSRHTAHESVGSDDESNEDAFEAMEGMHPFLVAAVLGNVSAERQRPPSFLHFDQTPQEHANNLARKDLQTTRTIFGLLRLKPAAVAKYRQYATEWFEAQAEAEEEDIYVGEDEEYFDEEEQYDEY